MTEVIAKVLAYTKLNAKQLAERIGLDRPQAIYDLKVKPSLFRLLWRIRFYLYFLKLIVVG